MIIPYGETQPRIDESCFIAPNCVSTGDVGIGTDSSIWFEAVIRGNIHSITIGQYTNILDNAVVHVTQGKFSTAIGDRGLGAILHGCTIENECIIGMGAVILNDSVIGEGSIVAAGSVVKDHETIPFDVLIAGNPAIIKRDLAIAERKAIKQSAISYNDYIKGYKL